MYIRYNESSKYFEYDSSSDKDGSGPWLVLPISAADQLTDGLVPTARLGSGTADNTTFLRGDQTWVTPAASGDVSGPASSAAGEVALFDGTTGKLIKRATGSGIAKLTSGVLSAISLAGDTSKFLNESGAFTVPTLPGVVKIDEATPTGTGTVTFSSLSGYSHLEIIFSGRGTDAVSTVILDMTFNGDTGANYYRQKVLALNTTVAAQESIGANALSQVGVLPGSTVSAGVAGSGRILIVDYANSSLFKTVKSEQMWFVSLSSSGQIVQTHGGFWANDDPITTLSISCNAGNYDTGTKFSLYGYR